MVSGVIRFVVYIHYARSLISLCKMRSLRFVDLCMCLFYSHIKMASHIWSVNQMSKYSWKIFIGSWKSRYCDKQMSWKTILVEVYESCKKLMCGGYHRNTQCGNSATNGCAFVSTVKVITCTAYTLFLLCVWFFVLFWFSWLHSLTFLSA